MTTVTVTQPQNKTSRGPWLLKLDLTLTFEGGLHIGTGSSLHVHTDSPVMRDSQGQPILPASSVRGMLRNWCSREAGVLGVELEALYRLFGPEQKGNRSTEFDQQGRLTVITYPLQVQSTEIRDHLRLDPASETVAEGAKFDQELAWCKEAKLTLTYEGDGPDDPEVKLLKAVIVALEAGLLSLGGKAGTGLGAIASCQVIPQFQHRAEPKGLFLYLQHQVGKRASVGDRADLPTLSYQQPRLYQAHEPLPFNWLTLNLQLQFEGPLLIGGPDRRPKSIADATYLTRPDGTAYLSGSALRGVLHSQARRIVNSLGKEPLLDKLFGSIKGQGGVKGMLRVGEGKLNPEKPVKEVFLNHVAIDRISGFASDQALFNALALASPCFDVKLRIFWRPTDQAEMASVILLLFLLRDLEAGWLWLGANTTAGYGHISGLSLQGGQYSVVTLQDNLFQRQATVSLNSLKDVAELSQQPAFASLWQAWNT